MRKIDLSSYDVTVMEKDAMVTLPYDVKGSLVNGLYHSDLRLGYKELFENDKIARKIRDSNGFVLLEEAEYEKLKQAFEIIKGFTKEDVELVRRVIEAPEVSVKEE